MPDWTTSESQGVSTQAEGLNAGTTFGPACLLSRARWYREQAALALQRGHETRDPTVRAGFDELVREWLRIAAQAEWIENQQRPPLARSTSRRNRAGDFARAVFRCSPKKKTLTTGGCQGLFGQMGSWGLGTGAHPVALSTPPCLPRSVFR